MLSKLPKHTPPLGVMLADLGNPHPLHIARALGVNERTVRRWVSSDQAPRPVLLALFWLTRWGSQWLDADLFNLARTHIGLSEALQKELALLRTNDKAAPRFPQARPMLYVVR